jgi:hypothetical protein
MMGRSARDMVLLSLEKRPDVLPNKVKAAFPLSLSLSPKGEAH